MEGNLRDTPLSSVLELVHLTKQSGRIAVMSARLPLSLSFSAGEIVAGGILDWQGLEAIQSFDLHAASGSFRFTPSTTPVRAQFEVGFNALMTDWARVNDEWARIRRLIDSPSRVLEYTGSGEHAFGGGKSIRSVARATQSSVFELSAAAAAMVTEGTLRPVERYAWMGLRIQHPNATGSFTPMTHDTTEIPQMLSGKRNLAELLQWGFSVQQLRRYLLGAISARDIEVPGGGWLLRDLTWELEGPGASG
jgi:hypothetical protein